MTTGLPETYAMDVTLWPTYCFCPFDPKTGELVLGLNLCFDVAPGPIVAIFHSDGDAAVEAWCQAHPDLEIKYRLSDGTTGTCLLNATDRVAPI